jgi:hypothetical protein
VSTSAVIVIGSMRTYVHSSAELENTRDLNHGVHVSIGVQTEDNGKCVKFLTCPLIH